MDLERFLFCVFFIALLFVIICITFGSINNRIEKLEDYLNITYSTDSYYYKNI